MSLCSTPVATLEAIKGLENEYSFFDMNNIGIYCI